MERERSPNDRLRRAQRQQSEAEQSKASRLIKTLCAHPLRANHLIEGRLTRQEKQTDWRRDWRRASLGETRDRAG